VVLGQVSEGYATQNGELALGRNLKVAFMPWKGYNLRMRLISEKWFVTIFLLLFDDYSLEVRDTKLVTKLTNDIPNVSEDY
jgi:DNA-directed RNA polymerase subunit beta